VKFNAVRNPAVLFWVLDDEAFLMISMLFIIAI
jgi:hypothetical protein